MRRRRSLDLLSFALFPHRSHPLPTASSLIHPSCTSFISRPPRSPLPFLLPSPSPPSLLNRPDSRSIRAPHPPAPASSRFPATSRSLFLVNPR